MMICAFAGCSQREPSVLRLATTTSVRDSGLLDQLIPEFERTHPCRTDVIAVGTGAALQLGKAGDVDALLVHAPAAEEDFMQQGYGIRRNEFMVNHFLLVGSADDPAGVRDMDATDAFAKIRQAASLFVSRGDDSGTHKKEKEIWELVGMQPDWPGYMESGQGMGATLAMANEKQAYTLTDNGTYLHFREKIDLIPLSTKSVATQNVYSVLVIHPAKHPAVNLELANAFCDFMLSDSTQTKIGQFQIGGEPLFTPMRSR
ncbi:MAG: substrate-binding domain-containing protein [Pirellulaceae bacterium]